MPCSQELELFRFGGEGLVVDLVAMVSSSLGSSLGRRSTFSASATHPLYEPGSGYLEPCLEVKAAWSTTQPSGASGEMSKTFGPEKYGLLPPRCSRGLNESALATTAKAASAVVYLTILWRECYELDSTHAHARQKKKESFYHRDTVFPT